MVRLTKNQESALRTLRKLVKEKHEDCIPTREINRRSRLNVSVGTMRSLEKKNLVEFCEPYHFQKPYLVVDGNLKPIDDYSQIPVLEEQGEEIAWIDATSYSWKLTSSGREMTEELERERKKGK